MRSWKWEATAGRALLILVVFVAVAAPWLAPNPPDRQFDAYLYAPPTRIHGTYFYPLRLISRLERRFEEVRERPVSVRWFGAGHLVSSADPNDPLLLLGADSYGRDIFSRLVYGSRASLGLAALATLATMIFGAVVGGIAGYAGGAIDEILSRFSDFVLVLPAIYVVLALRAVMPLVLPPGQVFALLVGIFALVSWPVVARGVRGIIASEREREYVTAGRAAGASPMRLLAVHLMPAARGYLTTQATLLLPAFILAEATLSYVGLGFPTSVPTWGTMLYDASNVALVGEAPWMLAPAAAIFLVVLAVNLVVQGSGRPPLVR
ncbi:MAG: ABC transporter permease [Acidobacteria bacterium]|nr:MAG: ABC transporter permease [Acidobacteriota bacterium]